MSLETQFSHAQQHSNNMELNLELRTEILRFSLHLEEGVNNLLLLNIGILDGGKVTRLFGNKAGINFKNKIDFLYDIEVFTKSENFEMELLSVFRNKLLHDISYNSLLLVLDSLDSGLRTRFKIYLEKGHSVENELHCRRALTNLFLKNIKTLRVKSQEFRELNKKKNELIQSSFRRSLQLIDTFYDFLSDISEKVQNSTLQDPQAVVLATEIRSIVAKYNDFSPRVNEQLFEFEVFSGLFGIKKMSVEQAAEMEVLYDEYCSKFTGRTDISSLD